MRRIFSATRYLTMIPILGTLITAIVIVVYGGLASIALAYEVINHAIFTTDEAKHISIAVIEILDLFLLGTVLYIISLGLYELFIDKDLPVPAWLVIENLEDLKGNLVGVIIVLLAVTFLSYVVTWEGNTNILALGVGVGLVLVALGTIFGSRFQAHVTRPRTTNPLPAPDDILQE